MSAELVQRVRLVQSKCARLRVRGAVRRLTAGRFDASRGHLSRSHDSASRFVRLSLLRAFQAFDAPLSVAGSTCGATSLTEVSPLVVAFVAGSTGLWRIGRVDAVVGDPVPIAER